MPNPAATAAEARSRFTLRRLATGDRTFAHEIRAGMTAVRKSIPARFFYDELGSSLFEAICHLPEYYPTRAEDEILRKCAAEIVAAAGEANRLVEFGSGTGRKTRHLLDALARDRDVVEYIPIDVDPHVLEKSAHDLTSDYPGLQVNAVCADFTRPSRALAGALRGGRTLVIFLGSTIGNFHPGEAVAMLRDLRRVLNPGDAFLLGADLKKSKQVLELAYNDPLGITAAFNINLLQRINRELGGHFDLRAFAHRAFYDEERGRIEMHLVSLRDQTVLIDALNLSVSFAEGETIHTENSYKYDEADLEQLASESGFEISGLWTDSRGLFVDVLMRAK